MYTLTSTRFTLGEIWAHAQGPPQKIINLSKKKSKLSVQGVIRKAAAKLVKAYKDDLELSLGFELIQFKEFSKLFNDAKIDHFSLQAFPVQVDNGRRFSGHASQCR